MKTKTLLILATILILGGGVFYACAADTNAVQKLTSPDASPFSQGTFSISPFTGINVASYKPLNGRIFTGLGVEYSVANQVGIALEGALDDTDKIFVDQYGAEFRGYLPFWKTGLAGYGELGWQHLSATRRDALLSGAGLCVRWKNAGLKLGARWLQNFKEVGNAQFITAAEWNF